MMTFKTLVFALLLTLSVSAQNAWSYRGIPYPTDNVPGAIMPTLPTGADTAGWPYDPCTIATPTFASGANQYYVDTVNGVDVTAGNSQRGSVGAPRKTLPFGSAGTGGLNYQWTFPAGTEVFVTANSTLGTVNVDQQITSEGTSSSRVWLIGVGGKPAWVNKNIFVHGSHMLFDNIKVRPPTGNESRITFGGNGAGCSYITFRNGELDANFHGNNAIMMGNGYPGDPSRFVMIYNNIFHDGGNWRRVDGDNTDRHACQPNFYAYHWWIIGNTMWHFQGDGVQVNYSGHNNGIYAARPHYIYIAGNLFYEMYEQGVDCKNSFHVIISENTIWGSNNPLISSNRTGMILINDGEGWVSSRHWALFNTIYDCGKGIKVAPTQAETIDNPAGLPPIQTSGSKAYIIGNAIWDCGLSIQIDSDNPNFEGLGTGKTWGTEIWVVENSLSGIIKEQSNSEDASNPCTKHILGNLIWNPVASATDADIQFQGDTGQTNNVNHNVIYRAGAAVLLQTAKHDSHVGNVVDADPLVLGFPDMRLAASSPARNIVPTRPACYQTFEDLYGIDIDRSLNGVVRAPNSDAGAYEWTAGQAGRRYSGTLTLDGSGIAASTAGAGVPLTTTN